MTRKRRNRWQPKRSHVSLYLKHKGRCFYCECELVLPVTKKQKQWPSRITREHLIPRSLGGRGLDNNVVAACQHCNSKRGNRPWQDFLAETRRSRGLDPASPPMEVTRCPNDPLILHKDNDEHLGDQV